MSGLVSGISKVFTSVASSVVNVGKAILGVGATTMTAGAASGAGSILGGGLNSVIGSITGGGVLANVLTGAIRQAAIGSLVGGAIGAITGAGFGKGALYGGLGGAALGGIQGLGGGLYSSTGLVPANTPSGMTPTGSAAATAAPSLPAAAAAPAAAAPSGGFASFLGSESGGALLSGLGQGVSAYAQARMEAAEREKDRDFLREKQETLTRSYDLPDTVMPGNNPGGGMAPTTLTPSGAPKPKASTRWRYQYDPSAGNVVRVPA